MTLPKQFDQLRLPAIVAPMFLIAGPDLVVEACRAGLIGTFPAANQRTVAGYDLWIKEISERLSLHDVRTPFGVNLIVNKSNNRLEEYLEVTIANRVPLVITSLGIRVDVIRAIQSYGGLVFHDVSSRRHAELAAAAGVDGIIAVSAGAGGHTGTTNPFALLEEIRSVFDGTIILGGCINTGRDILAARIAGADMAYMGTRFIATKECTAPTRYKDMIVSCNASDIMLSKGISGFNANFLRPSLIASGLDPETLQPRQGAMNTAGEKRRAWKDVWAAGQGVGGITDQPSVAELCDRLIAEYKTAAQQVALDAFV